MPQSLNKVFIHVIFSTKNREPFILSEIQDRLYGYMATLLRNLDCPVIKIGGTNNHVHILMMMSRTHTIADVLRQLKYKTSIWVRDSLEKAFAWQEGYAVFSVSADRINTIRRYIENQQQHHHKKTFEEECREIFGDDFIQF